MARIRGATEILRTLPLVAYDPDPSRVRDILAPLKIDVLELRPTVTITELETPKHLVLGGAGWSVLPDHAIAGDLRKDRLFEVRLGHEWPQNSLNPGWFKSPRLPRVSFACDLMLEASAGDKSQTQS